MGVQIAQCRLSAEFPRHRQTLGLDNKEIICQHGLSSIKIARPSGGVQLLHESYLLFVCHVVPPCESTRWAVFSPS